MKNRSVVLFVTIFVSLMFAGGTAFCTEDLPVVPTEGMVTVVDLGAKKCIPCKMMAPILEELKREYNGRASILFIDVWEHREQAEKYSLRAIPTQIFYDREGKEAYRHLGFMDKQTIEAKLKELGVQ